jgi:hypothetical protein
MQQMFQGRIALFTQLTKLTVEIEAARKLLGHTTQKQTADYIRSIKGVSATAIEKIIRQQGE